MPCKHCRQEGHNARTCARKELTAPEPREAMPPRRILEDTYSEDLLRESFTDFRTHYAKRLAMKERTNGAIRCPNTPEDISENFLKFVIRNKVGVSSSWAKLVGRNGDLWSDVEGVQECKWITSEGPCSFGPDKDWAVIYFGDAREWLSDKFRIYRVDLTAKSPEWQAIRMSATETFGQQCAQGRRPHIGWEALRPQLGEHCKLIYEGGFEGIFSKETSLPAMSSTTGTETALPASEYSLASESAGSV